MSDDTTSTQSVLTTGHAMLTKYAAFTSEHTEKVVAEYHRDIMARVQKSLTSYVPAAIEKAQTEREARENTRAVRRNRNRILTLLVVLVMEMIVPTLAVKGWLPGFFVKYEVLAITLPDALLTVYAYLRKY